MISFDYANVEEDYFRDGGGDGEGVIVGGSLGGEGKFGGSWWDGRWWGGCVREGWKRH